MNIYVGSLNFKMTEADLKERFEEYGEVTSAKIIIDKYPEKVKDLVSLEMPNEAEAKKLLKSLMVQRYRAEKLSLTNQLKERKEEVISEVENAVELIPEITTGRK